MSDSTTRFDPENPSTSAAILVAALGTPDCPRSDLPAAFTCFTELGGVRM